ncbi:Oidioi.mRNA.OKI2018_I69.XSR.g14653.t1.cds [Oikopleura dioica]|uniref:Oidioi.mRNA.OKI2018_I69.XSR.g14653.t1.cds n=1 Tax=Oikopleura dioica TaxID=34765 RepID=A0ABN7SFN2_OIKDI|nr:Oidioi.mRNA.OKI2018_I69.XSR.g14653.t1.cds [Oikopleura dioica]
MRIHLILFASAAMAHSSEGDQVFDLNKAPLFGKNSATTGMTRPTTRSVTAHVKALRDAFRELILKAEAAEGARTGNVPDSTGLYSSNTSGSDSPAGNDAPRWYQGPREGPPEVPERRFPFVSQLDLSRVPPFVRNEIVRRRADDLVNQLTERGLTFGQQRGQGQARLVEGVVRKAPAPVLTPFPKGEQGHFARWIGVANSSLTSGPLLSSLTDTTVQTSLSEGHGESSQEEDPAPARVKRRKQRRVDLNQAFVGDDAGSSGGSSSSSSSDGEGEPTPRPRRRPRRRPAPRRPIDYLFRYYIDGPMTVPNPRFSDTLRSTPPTFSICPMEDAAPVVNFAGVFTLAQALNTAVFLFNRDMAELDLLEAELASGQFGCVLETSAHLFAIGPIASEVEVEVGSSISNSSMSSVEDAPVFDLNQMTAQQFKNLASANGFREERKGCFTVRESSFILFGGFVGIAMCALIFSALLITGKISVATEDKVVKNHAVIGPQLPSQTSFPLQRTRRDLTDGQPRMCFECAFRSLLEEINEMRLQAERNVHTARDHLSELVGRELPPPVEIEGSSEAQDTFQTAYDFTLEETTVGNYDVVYVDDDEDHVPVRFTRTAEDEEGSVEV